MSSPIRLKTIKEKARDFHTEVGRKGKEIAEKYGNVISQAYRIADKKAIASAIYEMSSMLEKVQRVVAMLLFEAKALLTKSCKRNSYNLIENAMAQEGGGDVPE